jgi:ribosomal protein S18 acetylase RimI-like enzyme
MGQDEKMGRITLRRARRDDLPAIARLAAALVRQHHDFDPLRFMRIEPIEEGYEWFLGTQIDRDDVVLLVAVIPKEGEETIAGYVLGGLGERNWMDLLDACGKIHDLYVDGSARGLGVGARLLEEAIASLEALGAPRVVLSTAWHNEGARRFFERAGFRPTMIEMTREAGSSGDGRAVRGPVPA